VWEKSADVCARHSYGNEENRYKYGRQLCGSRADAFSFSSCPKPQRVCARYRQQEEGMEAKAAEVPTSSVAIRMRVMLTGTIVPAACGEKVQESDREE